MAQYAKRVNGSLAKKGNLQERIAAIEGTDNAKRAREREKLADKLEKDNGKAKGAAAIGGALAATAAAYLAGRKGRAA